MLSHNPQSKELDCLLTYSVSPSRVLQLRQSLAQIFCTSPLTLGKTSPPSLFWVLGSAELPPPCPPVVAAGHCLGGIQGIQLLDAPTHIYLHSVSTQLPVSSPRFVTHAEDAQARSYCGSPHRPNKQQTIPRSPGGLDPLTSGTWQVPHAGQTEGP